MTLLRSLYTKLKLKVNETKSAVASVFKRKFLGFSFWVAKGGVIQRRVADKPMARFQQRVRQLTRRTGGKSMAQVVEKLRPFLLGWKAYFGMAQTPNVWRKLDTWLRHRLSPVSIPFCSLFSKNSGEPCSSGTRRKRLKTMGYTCVEKGGLTGGLVQESGG